jgi:hypothetical protein
MHDAGVGYIDFIFVETFEALLLSGRAELRQPQKIYIKNKMNRHTLPVAFAAREL